MTRAWVDFVERAVYWLQRAGRAEWLGADGQIVTDPRAARLSYSLAEANAWRSEAVDDPTVWLIQPAAVPCLLCGRVA